MLFLLISLFIAASQYLFVHTLRIERLSFRGIVAGFLFFAQIILTILFCGVVGLLYAEILVLLNVIICLFLIRHSINRIEIKKVFVADYAAITSSGRELCNFENAFLSVLVIIATAWILLATYFFPPRGTDDVSYHLPAVYEFVLNHKIRMLPVKSLHLFSFPMNANLLFVWPVILLQDTRWIEGVQLLIGLYGIIVLYGLGCMFRLSRQNALFISLLFFLTPVVLKQAGCNYIDLIVSVFLLLSLFFALLFLQNKRLLFFYLLFAAIGLLIGMKYHMLALAFFMMLMVIPKVMSLQRKHLFAGIALIFLLGGYWYLRNFILLGNPLYPMNLRAGGFGLVQGDVQTDFFEKITLRFHKIYLLYSKDLGFATMLGGMGLIFWGLAFPSWLIVWLKSFKGFLSRKDYLNFLTWTIVALGIALLLSIGIKDLTFTIRYVVFIVPISFLAMAQLWFSETSKDTYRRTIKGLCITFALLQFSILAMPGPPHYMIDAAIKDIIHGEYSSESKYFSQANFILPHVRYEAELLEYLTKDDAQGVTSYVVSDPFHFKIGHLYGRYLQNRVWNLMINPPAEPDVFISHYWGEKKDLVYIGKKITPEEVIADQRYFMVSLTPRISIFIKKEALSVGKRRVRLMEYYEDNFRDLILLSQGIITKLDKNIPVVTSQYIGFGLRYWQLKGVLANPVYWLPSDKDHDFAIKHGFKEFYSINACPSEDYSVDEIFNVNENLFVFRCIKKKV